MKIFAHLETDKCKITVRTIFTGLSSDAGKPSRDKHFK